MQNNKLSNYLYYVAANNSQGVKALATSLRMPQPKSLESAFGFLASQVKNKGDEGLLTIAAIHPDKDLLEAYFKSKKSQSSSADGTSSTNDIVEKKYEGIDGKHLLLLIIAAVLLISIFNGKL